MFKVLVDCEVKRKESNFEKQKNKKNKDIIIYI